MKATTLVTLAILLIGSAAHADPCVTATYRPLEGGGYRLDFALRLDQSSSSSYGWGLFNTDITDLVAPLGWRAETDVRKTNWDSLSPEYDVSPGGTLHGSAGTFGFLPTQLDYFVRLTGTGGDFSGTLVPTPIPEPPCLVALSGLISAVGFMLKRSRSKPAESISS